MSKFCEVNTCLTVVSINCVSPLRLDVCLFCGILLPEMSCPFWDVVCGNGALNPDIFFGNVNTPESILLVSKVKTPFLSTRMFGEGQISCEQLCEFLKYATQGKHHNVTQPR